MKRFFILILMALSAVGVWGERQGYVGRLIGDLRVRVLPRDMTLLGYFDANTKAVALAQLPLARSTLDGALIQRQQAFLRDVESVSGVRFILDIDVVATDGQVIVARGRFDWGRMSPRLAESGYVITNEGGLPLAVHQSKGEALLVDGAYAIYGAFDNVKAALDRRRAGKGLTASTILGSELDHLGFAHGLIVAGRVSEDRPALSDLVSFQPLWPRLIAGTFDVSPEGVPIGAYVTPATQTGAEDLEKAVRSGMKRASEHLEREDSPEAKEAKRVLDAAELGRDDSGRVFLRFVVTRTLVDLGTARLERAAPALSPQKGYASALGDLLQALSR